MEELDLLRSTRGEGRGGRREARAVGRGAGVVVKSGRVRGGWWGVGRRAGGGGGGGGRRRAAGGWAAAAAAERARLRQRVLVGDLQLVLLHLRELGEELGGRRLDGGVGV